VFSRCASIDKVHVVGCTLQFETCVVIFIDSYLGSARLYVHDIFVACGSYEFDFVFHYILLNMLK
jgi:hypothetical protein